MDGSGSDVTNADVYNFIKDNLTYDQLIWEFGTDDNPDWVHVSYSRNKNRKQQLKAVKKMARLLTLILINFYYSHVRQKR